MNVPYFIDHAGTLLKRVKLYRFLFIEGIKILLGETCKYHFKKLWYLMCTIQGGTMKVLVLRGGLNELDPKVVKKSNL